MSFDSPFSPGANVLDPAFQRSWSESGEGLRTLCTEVGPRVFAFPLLTPEACGELLEEVDRRSAAYESRRQAPDAPNSMHSYGVLLEEIGMQDWLVELRSRWLAPLARLLFTDTGGASLDGQHGFLVDYASDKDQELGFHVDDSAVTLNLCLGDDFSGSEIYFRGLRCDLHRQSDCSSAEEFEFHHEVGTALLHAGRHRHGVHCIRRGRRRNLILWMQSALAKKEAEQCVSWCGVHRQAP